MMQHAGEARAPYKKQGGRVSHQKYYLVGRFRPGLEAYERGGRPYIPPPIKRPESFPNERKAAANFLERHGATRWPMKGPRDSSQTGL